MSEKCKCWWDGALDGHIKRCKMHQAIYIDQKNMEKAAQEAAQAVRDGWKGI